MLGAAPSVRAQPLLSSGRSRGPFQHGHPHASNAIGLLRQRRRGLDGFTCRTLEADEVAGYEGAGGQEEAWQQSSPAAKTTSATSETFQQLRKAVLSSLDIADNAEQTHDFDDLSDADQFDVISAEAPTAASVGRAVYEVGAGAGAAAGGVFWQQGSRD